MRFVKLTAEKGSSDDCHAIEKEKANLDFAKLDFEIQSVFHLIKLLDNV